MWKQDIHILSWSIYSSSIQSITAIKFIYNFDIFTQKEKVNKLAFT